MKLLQHTARYQLLLAVPLVLIGTAIGYYAVQHIVNEEIDEQLYHHAAVVQDRSRQGLGIMPNSAPDQSLSIATGSLSEAQFSDTLIYNSIDEEDLPWRIGRFPIQMADGRPGVLTLGRATVEFEDLIEAIALTMGAMLLLLFLGSVGLNRWMNRRLWEPFHSTLAATQRFHVDGPEPPPFATTTVDEFRMMNDRLGAMMRKMRTDFIAQKRFSEQAAHELQTPLAIMQGKLDELIQEPDLGREAAELIDMLYRARERMGRTVANMLLLSRIGNHEFAPSEVDWEALFKDQLQALDDLIGQRQLRVQLESDHRCRIRLHPALAELIAANLLRNAVQHNHQGGHLNIRIRETALVITNSGPVLEVDPESLFDRFAKGDPSSSGAGLGLSMVKEVCDQAGLELKYTDAGGSHTVVIRSHP
ncbi:MAG: HAMP domain-containing histidine kinase [Flavobacteriales bacterium]|nr:HAMP domain-containing histidine kinase [Flavobacteriales bacterium]